MKDTTFTEQLKPIKLNLAQEISSLNANLIVNWNNSSADLQSI
ncbi:hypothetical protein Q7W34_00700 [Streptococcus suis]|nr:hypothetical protein [Streptococcus suis]